MNINRPLHRSSASARSGGFFPRDRGAALVLVLTLIAAVLLIAALDHASGIAVPTVMAVLAAIALAPLARRIESIGAPASLAAALIVTGVVLTSAFTIYSLLPSAEAWNARAPQVIREIEQSIRHIDVSISNSIGATSKADPVEIEPQGLTQSSQPEPTPETEEPASGEDAIDKLVDEGQRLAADWAISAPDIVAGALYWSVLTFFLLRDRAMLGRKVMALGGALSSKRALAHAMQDVQNNVANYLLAITLINAALGLCVAGVFYLFGVPNAALWGVAAGVLNFMPFIGAAIMALITVGVGLVTFDDPLVAVILLGVVVALNTIEAQFATPMVIGARIRLSAIGIFVAIAFGAWLWGAAGALVATPVLIVVSAFVTRLTAARRATLPLSSDQQPLQPGPG